jgi:DNA polymerase epsilon subunit 1
VHTVKRVEKEDLSMPNHLLGYKRAFLQLLFHNTQDLTAVRSKLAKIATENEQKMDAFDAYADVVR